MSRGSTSLLRAAVVVGLVVGTAAPLHVAEAKKKCSWRYPKKCLKKPRVTIGRDSHGLPKVPTPQVPKEVVVAAMPATVIVDLATGKPVGTVGGNVARTATQAIADTQAEGSRAVTNVASAAVAAARFVEGNARGWADAAEAQAARIRQGKLADAFWHAAIDQWRIQEAAAATAVQESKLLNTVGSVAASTYGGPQGAAAYAAWYAYRASDGDLDLAVRVGIITGLASQGLSVASELPADDATALLKKSLAAGAIGGAAVAAAGGDEAAMREAFLRGGGMILMQEAYTTVAGQPLDPRASQGKPYCFSAMVVEDCNVGVAITGKDEAGRLQFDVGTSDPARPHVGLWAPKPELHPGLGSEASLLMTGLSKVPGFNGMAFFHDQWSVDWDMNAFLNVASIAPAVVVTYYGTQAPTQTLIVETAVGTGVKVDLDTPRADATTPPAPGDAGPDPADDDADG